MREIVLDAFVLVKWFKTAGEEDVRAAQSLRTQFTRGELLIVVPPLLFLELLNVAARRWQWEAAEVERLAEELAALGFEVQQPLLPHIAHWCNRGLSAYDAC